MERLRRLSFVIVWMPTDSSSPFNNVDKEKLKQLAKSKNHEMLRELGGVDGIILSLKTHAGYGIRGDDADLRNRIDFFASNTCGSTRDVCYQYLLAMLRRFKKISFLFLCACSVYLIIVGIILYGWEDGWQDGTYGFVFSLFLSVISSTIEKGVGAYFDKAIKGSQLVIVLRNGVKHQIPVSSLLVGDIVLLTKWDRIPADGLLLEASGGYQSLKSGESQDREIVETTYSDPFLRAGAKVGEGQVKMMVTSSVVGTNTSGIIEKTKLRVQIDYLVRSVEIMKWLLAMSSILISVSRYAAGRAEDDQGYSLFDRGRTSTLEVSYAIVEYVVAAGVIFMAMDAKSFSWALKVCFSHAINMMAASDVIVRNLPSWEKIGVGMATINVTDHELSALNRLMISNFLFVPQMTANKEVSSHVSPDVLQLLRQGIGLNTTGISNHAQHKCGTKFLGSPSERAFLSEADLESNMDWEKLMNDCAIVKVENLENQVRVILVKKDDSFLEHRRGPAEVILAMCLGYYDDAGIQHTLDEDTRSLLEQKLQSINSDSRAQTIALAFRQQVPNGELKDDSNSDKNEDCYNLLGFVVLKEIVQDVVQKENFDDVAELRQTEMNSDATNLETTAPSESISVGIQGDETTGTSDIMILDRKIPTSLILTWSKGILHNTRSFTQFQLTLMSTSIADAFVRLVLPVKTSGVNKALGYQVVQQTWVSTGMGFIAVITFGRQKHRRPSSVTLPQQPVPEDGKIWILTGYMLRNIMTQSAYQIIAFGVLQFKGTIFGFADEALDATTFVVPIFLQVLNMISARKIEEKNIFSGIRPRFIGLVAGLMVVPFVLVEILARIGYFERLDGKQWAICIAIAMVSWPFGLAAKFVPVGFFAILVHLVAVPMMAVANRLVDLWNWIKSVVSNIIRYGYDMYIQGDTLDYISHLNYTKCI
ncbi:putative calcium-transporting ATPase 13, plasma membrane-type [Henckelia pumila]|uniref:putative calcium-transporting ATPase 13, plasma membrane-type n=1 Tax=Henckelia pumila TaxID=405737 RepID=UPI003C6DF1FD